LTDEERQALDADAAELERQFFANGPASGGVDLKQLASRWLAAAGNANERPIR
jgi:hypothetical protein